MRQFDYYPLLVVAVRDWAANGRVQRGPEWRQMWVIFSGARLQASMRQHKDPVEAKRLAFLYTIYRAQELVAKTPDIGAFTGWAALPPETYSRIVWHRRSARQKRKRVFCVSLKLEERAHRKCPDALRVMAEVQALLARPGKLSEKELREANVRWYLELPGWAPEECIYVRRHVPSASRERNDAGGFTISSQVSRRILP